MTLGQASSPVSPALAGIMAGLKAQSLDQAPLSVTADAIDLLNANQLKAFKKKTDAGKLADWVKNRYTKARAARSGEEQQWYKNLDMYQGRQFTEWNTTDRRMIEPPAPDYEPRLAVNVIEPAVRTEMSTTGSKRPQAVVSPASNDDADIMAALAGQDVWDWFYAQMRFQTKIFSPANLWRTVCGNGFLKTFYDPNCVDEDATKAAQQAADKAYTQQQQDALAQNVTDLFPATAGGAAIPVPPVMGKIKAQHVDPFHLFVADLAELDIQEQDWVLHVYTMNAEKAKIVYKDYVASDWEPTTVTASTIFNMSHLGIRGAQRPDSDQVLVIEAWVKPGVTSLLPKGGLVITVANEIVALADDGLPYNHGEFPFAHLTSIESGRFYRKSMVESVINIQNEKNRTYAQAIKHKNLATKPQYFFDEGSVDPRKITSRAGQYIPVRLGMNRPSPVPIVPLQPWVLDLMDRLTRDMDDITGQHDVSRGQAPGANSAANAIAALQESDNSFLFSAFDSIEAGMETVGRQYLSLVVQYWTEPRIVAVTGRDHSNDAQLLSGVDIEGGTDIRVESGSALPTSKAARVAIITDWIKNQIITAADGLEAMEMGTLGKVYDKIKVDSDAAKRENLTMRDLDVAQIQQWMQAQQAQQAQQQAFQQAEARLEGQAQQALGGITDPAVGLQPPAQPAMPARQSGETAVVQPGAVAPAASAPAGQLVGSAQPAPALPDQPIFFPINWMDNDQIHMQEHRAYANSQAYSQLPDEVKQVFEDHYYAHLTRSLNLTALGAERQSAQAAQEAAEMAQQAPTVQMTSRVGGLNQYAGEQFSK